MVDTCTRLGHLTVVLSKNTKSGGFQDRSGMRINTTEEDWGIVSMRLFWPLVLGEWNVYLAVL